jgi:AraC-like DNA-binding protein
MGPRASSLLVEGDCAPSYLEAWLVPLGAYRLLGLPMDELSGQLADLADVLGAAGRRLAEHLRQAPGWRQRFTLMDQFLLRRLASGPRPSPEVGWAWHRLITTRGTVPIGWIADEVGWSHKHLIARFRRQAGLRPKTAARLIRLDAVWQHLDEQPEPLDWGQVAADAGYADQAHLIRDFRQFTGTTPTGYQALMPRPTRDGGPHVNSVQDAVAAAS